MLLLGGSLQGQDIQIDSLRLVLESDSAGRKQVQTIEHLTRSLDEAGLDSMRQMRKVFLGEVDVSGCHIQNVKHLFQISYGYFLEKNDVEAIKYALSVIDILEKCKDPYNYLRYRTQCHLGTSYNRLGFLFNTRSLYLPASEYLLEALEALSRVPDTYKERYELHTLLGNSLHGMADTVRAEMHYQEAENLAREMGDNEAIVRAMLNRGNLYMRHRMGDYGEEITLKSLEFSKRIGYDKGILYSYLNLSQIVQYKEMFERAKEYARLAIDYAQTREQDFVKYRAWFELANAYIGAEEYEQAIHALEQCLDYFSREGQYNHVKLGYQFLADLHLKLGQYESTTWYQGKYIALTDSLANADLDRQVEMASTYRDLEVLQVENQLLDLDLRLQEQRTRSREFIVLIALFALILLVILIIIQFRAKTRYRRQSKQISEQNEIILSQNLEIGQQNEELQKYKANLEKLIDERTHELREALELAKESSRLKSTFLQNISHEIRTPMNAIIGFSDLIQTRADRKSIETNLDFIAKSSQDLLQTVNNILSITLLETESIHLDLESYSSEALNRSLSEHLNKTAALYEHQANISFNMDLDHFNGSIKTDLEKMKRILAYLLENAFKFTPEGSINVHSRHGIAQFEISITDTGEGIEEEQMDVIFEKFRKGKDSSDFNRGTGLGLAIVDLLVKAMGASIHVESERGSGTTFTLSFPTNYGASA